MGSLDVSRNKLSNLAIHGARRKGKSSFCYDKSIFSFKVHVWPSILTLYGVSRIWRALP